VARQLRGNLDAAVADYDRALALDGRLALALHNRGMVRWKKNDRAGAAADFDAALAADPTLDIATEHRKALAREMARGAHAVLVRRAVAR
jgi:hypothetical protein